MVNHRIEKAEMTKSSQPVCVYCERKMHYSEWRAFYNEKTNVNDVICPQCFKKETGNENYTLDMLGWKQK